MWHRLNSYKIILQCHDESHAITSSSHCSWSCIIRQESSVKRAWWVLSSHLKAGRVVDEITSAGRAFQTRAAMTVVCCVFVCNKFDFMFSLQCLDTVGWVTAWAKSLATAISKRCYLGDLGSLGWSDLQKNRPVNKTRSIGSRKIWWKGDTWATDETIRVMW